MALLQTSSQFSVEEIEISKICKSSQGLRSNLGDVTGLARSISSHGLIAPIVVRPSEEKKYGPTEKKFEVVSGHRRLEALRQMGMTSVPCKVIDATEKESFELSLVENLQRQSLDPLEEALSFQYYLRVCKWGSARNLAQKIGKSVEYIHHRLKLLDLPENVLQMVGKELTASQAEELVWLGDPKIQTELAKIATKNKLTVKQLHELAIQERAKSKFKVETRDEIKEPECETRDWLPNISRNGPSTERKILENNVVAIRFALSFMDNSIGALNKMEKSEEDHLIDFMLEERYALHQLLDSFIKKIDKYR